MHLTGYFAGTIRDRFIGHLLCKNETRDKACVPFSGFFFMENVFQIKEDVR